MMHFLMGSIPTKLSEGAYTLTEVGFAGKNGDNSED